MAGKIEQAEFDALTKSIEDDFLALFLSMQGDVNEYLDREEYSDPHELIAGIDKLLNSEVNYKPKQEAENA